MALAELLDRGEPGLALTAKQVLQRIHDEDQPRLAVLARAALDAESGQARREAEERTRQEADKRGAAEQRARLMSVRGETVPAVPESGTSRTGRLHIVLVPGLAGFDALGQVEYYAGTTERYRDWLAAGGSGGQSVALHYNLPTSGVSTRAARLRAYLAKRIARGEIQDGDKIALVGHSTGGLDIRRLLFASEQALPELDLDGGQTTDKARATAIDIDQAAILKKVTRVVFVSVPQYGTNIADWVRGHALLRRTIIEDLLRAVDGDRIPPLEQVLSALLPTARAPVARSTIRHPRPRSAATSPTSTPRSSMK